MHLLDKYVIPEGTYDNGNRLGTKRSHQIKAYIADMSDERLKGVFTDFYDRKGRFDYDMPQFQEIVREIHVPGEFLNATMFMLTLAEAAYMRQDEDGNDLLDEDEYLRLQEEG